MSRARWWLLLLAASLLAGRTAVAERILSDQARVTLWTVGPGPELYAAWGHSALRIEDPVLGVDRLYNFGTFDFETPNFYLKFIQGDLDYLLTAGVALEILPEYRDRTGQLVVEQELSLTPEEKDRLLEDLERNLLPENAAYRYDFVHDNCSTRIRDAVGRAAAVRWPEPAGNAPTLRQMVQPYTRHLPAVSQGIDLLLTGSMDRAPRLGEATFLPEGMEQAFAGAVIAAGPSGGAVRPLVRETRVLCAGPRLPEATFPWVLVMAWSVALAGMAAALCDWKPWLWLDAVVMTGVGLVGVFLLFLWFGTRHWVLHGNWNLLWAWPTHLPVAFLPPALRRGYWRGYAVWVLAWVPALFVLPQSMAAVVPPLMLYLGFRAWAKVR